jgi:beta-glucosidase
MLDRYTLVGQSTTNSFTMPYDLVDRWTYKWYVLAFTNGGTQVSNTQQFGVYLPYIEQDADGVNIVNGCRDMNKNGVIEPFEDWHLTPEQRLNDLMNRLPLEEKFKQSFYGGGADPKNGFGFSYGVEHIMLDEQHAAATTPWAIPIAHAGDKIHGWKTIYPTQIGLAATRDPNLVYQCANMQRVEHKAFGFAGTLMPVAEVNTKVLNPRFQEGCGENADEAAATIRAMICGMQGGPEMNPHSMLVTVKHWPSQGAGGEGPTQYDERTIGYHMKPWHAMVEANAASVMPGYSSSPFIDPTGAGSNSSKPIIDYLRDQIGFDGFVVTDWLAANTAQSIESMSAGIDVLGGAPSSGTDVNQLVASIGMDRLNEACRRVLNMKIRLGLFENPYADPTTTWTNAEHHEIALNAARKSITLIKNNGVLPLNLGNGSQIGVAGPRATWANQDADPNVIWQSIYYDNPQTMNYVEAFVNRASANGINVVGGQGTNPNVAVVVIGELSYTHGTDWADKDPDIPADQLDAIRDFSNRGIPVITVVISPRPYVLTEVVNLSAAVMLVYRGGNGIAQATAELCFGDYNPSGKLPFQLPRSQDQVGTDVATDQIEHWELPYDIGASDAERAEIINLMANNQSIPATFGNPLFQYGEGIDNIYTIKEDGAQNEIVSGELSVFPNPTSTTLYVKYSSDVDSKIEVYSLSGYLLETTSISADEEYVGIDVSDFNAGYYFLKVSNGESVNMTQFIVK